MSTIKRFEDISAWKKARELNKQVFAISAEAPFSTDYKFRDQYRAACGSIMDNISEGFERGGKNEFKNFLRIAKGSAGEVKSQSYRALDCGYITEVQINNIYEQTDEIGKMLHGLVKYLKETEHRGITY